VGMYQCCHLLALFRRHWLQLLQRQVFNDAGVGSQVLLGADEYDGHLGTEVRDFGQPLVDDVAQAVRIGDAEEDQQNVSVRIRQRSANKQNVDKMKIGTLRHKIYLKTNHMDKLITPAIMPSYHF